MSNPSVFLSPLLLSLFTLGTKHIFLLVSKLDASGNAFGQAGGEAFVEALKSNSTLDSIVIGSKDKPATIPLKELRENSIDALDYQGKELLAEGGIVLASALKGNSSVTKVGQHVLMFSSCSTFGDFFLTVCPLFFLLSVVTVTLVSSSMLNLIVCEPTVPRLSQRC